MLHGLLRYCWCFSFSTARMLSQYCLNFEPLVFEIAYSRENVVAQVASGGKRECGCPGSIELRVSHLQRLGLGVCPDVCVP
jgi:hypothetical protein